MDHDDFAAAVVFGTLRKDQNLNVGFGLKEFGFGGETFLIQAANRKVRRYGEKVWITEERLKGLQPSSLG